MDELETPSHLGIVKGKSKKKRKFDQTDRDSIDSGRVSRRGAAEEDVVESDDELTPDVPGTRDDDITEKVSLAQCGWKKVRGKTLALAAIAAGGKEIPEVKNSGKKNTEAVGTEGESTNAMEESLALDSGYREDSFSENIDSARSSCLSGNMDVDTERWADSGQGSYEYRSVPASRLDDEQAEVDAADTGRGCKSARETGSSKEEKRKLALHKSKSSPSLGNSISPGQNTEQSGVNSATGGQEIVIPLVTIKRKSNEPGEAVRGCIQDKNVSQKGANKGSIGFGNVATAMSIAKKIQDAKKQSVKDQCAKGENLQNNTENDEQKIHAESRKSAGSAKSVRWEDMMTHSGSDAMGSHATGNSGPELSLNMAKTNLTGVQDCGVSEESSNISFSKIEDSSLLPNENKNSEVALLNNSSMTSAVKFVDCCGESSGNDAALREESKDSVCGNSDSSVTFPLTEMIHLLGNFKVSYECDKSSAAMLDDTNFIENWCLQFQEVVTTLKSWESSPQELRTMLPSLRDNFTEMRINLAKEFQGICREASDETEVCLERTDTCTDTSAAVTKVMLELCEVIRTAANMETSALGSTQYTEEAILIANQVRDGTYVPPTVIDDPEGDDCNRVKKTDATTDSSDTGQQGGVDTEDGTSQEGAGESENEDQSDPGLDETDRPEVPRICEWPRFVCETGACLGEDPVTCIVHANPEVVTFSEVRCEGVDPGVLPPVAEEYETLAGKIIRMTAENVNQISEENCYLVALPYRVSLVEAWRDVEVRELTDTGEWKPKPRTNHMAVLEDREESTIGYVEVETDRLSTLAVVACPKVEEIRFDEEGKKIQSSGDPRVSVNIAENTCYGECTMTLQVFVPDACAVHDYRMLHEDNGAFKAVSPMVELKFTEDITNPVTVIVPMTMPLKRLLRASGRPVPPPDPFDESELLLFQRKSAFEWRFVKYTKVKNVQGSAGMVTFEWFEKEGRSDMLYSGLRIQSNQHQTSANSNQNVEKLQEIALRSRSMFNDYISPYSVLLAKEAYHHSISREYDRVAILCVSKDLARKFLDVKATSFMKYLTLHTVEITLLQDPTCVSKVSVTLCPKQHGVRKKRPPKDQIDFTFVKELMMREGQPFYVSLRGNLKSSFQFPKQYLNYAMEPITFHFQVQVLDCYAQRSLPSHCGFLQLLDPLRIMAERKFDVKPKENIPKENPKPMVLSEICIKIPKPEPMAFRPLVRAPFNVKLNGGVSFEVLREVALEISDEWKQLALNLRLPHARIQSIALNARGSPPSHIALEILLSWVKRVPIYQDKARLLCEALIRCGRSDLVRTIREKDNKKKQIELQIATAYNLKKAIVIVCHSPTVVNQWRTLASRLGLSHDDLAELDFLSLDRHDVCRMALERWQSLASVRAEVKVLAQQLASLGCLHVAELISTAYGNV